jgi:hypothetical protein
MSRFRNEYSHLTPALLTAATQASFDRGIARSMAGLKGSAAPLRRAIAVAMRELSDRSMDVTQSLAHLNAIVENLGRGGPGDRISLMSGQPRWMAVRDQVLADARACLTLTPVADA